LAWNKSTDQIAAGGWSRTFQLWDGEGGPGSGQKQVQAILDIAIHPRGSKVAMALFEGKAVITEADGSQGRVWDAHAGPVNAVAWHPDGQTLVTGGYDNTLRFWDAETTEPQQGMLFFSDGGAVTFTAAGQLEHSDLPALEDDLVYFIESKDGAPRMLSPSEFEKQFQESGEDFPQSGG
jgi:WD40 repeat protein